MCKLGLSTELALPGSALAAAFNSVGETEHTAALSVPTVKVQAIEIYLGKPQLFIKTRLLYLPACLKLSSCFEPVLPAFSYSDYPGFALGTWAGHVWECLTTL